MDLLILENGVPIPLSEDNYCFLKCLSSDCDLYPNKDNSKSFDIKEELDNNEDIDSNMKENLNLSKVEFYKIDFNDEDKNE